MPDHGSGLIGTGDAMMGQFHQRGRIWWAKYYVNGRPVGESTGTEKSNRRAVCSRPGWGVRRPAFRCCRVRIAFVTNGLPRISASTIGRPGAVT